MADDIAYFLRRAETEAVRAIACDSVGVAALHQELCLLYTGQAVAALLTASLAHVRSCTGRPSHRARSADRATVEQVGAPL